MRRRVMLVGENLVRMCVREWGGVEVGSFGEGVNIAQYTYYIMRVLLLLTF